MKTTEIKIRFKLRFGIKQDHPYNIQHIFIIRVWLVDENKLINQKKKPFIKILLPNDVLTFWI
jgi:hypothetical protein